MPFRTIPDQTTRYGLIAFDADGVERSEGPDGLMSHRLLEITRDDAITNIFLFCHGWKGDMSAAVEQYDRWIGAFDTLAADRERAANVFPGFRPLYIGLHWPSLPWGNEEIGDGSFAGPDDESPALGREELFRLYLDRLGDTPEIRTALNTILDEARSVTSNQLPTSVRSAFLDLDRALDFSSEGPAGPPDADREPFDPDVAFSADEASFGEGGVFEGVLGVLRQFSYWSMKKRGRKIGEGGMHDFVVALQRATAAQNTRIHLMGHSFGCVVISSILKGAGDNSPLQRPIDSVALVQGAVSLWSWALAIPFERAGPGYFYQTLREGRIHGPLITTQSRFDFAVGRLYPLACQVSRRRSGRPLALISR